MKQQMFPAAVLAIIAGMLVQPAFSDGGKPPSKPSTKTQVKDHEASKKHHEDSDEVKLRKEIEAKREADKRKWLEEFDRRHGRHHSHDGGGEVIIVTDSTGSTGGGGGTGTDRVYTTPYRPAREPRPKSYAGILYAPAQKGKQAAFGVQWIGPKRFGVTAWVSGALGYDDDVIDSYIPHDDYWTDSTKGTYALEAVYGMGSDDAMLILGAGLAVTQTYYTDVSNVTGWKWEAGSESSVEPAAHASLRFRIADRVNMQFGYDTTHFAFFGLSGSF